MGWVSGISIQLKRVLKGRECQTRVVCDTASNVGTSLRENRKVRRREMGLCITRIVPVRLFSVNRWPEHERRHDSLSLWTHFRPIRMANWIHAQHLIGCVGVGDSPIPPGECGAPRALLANNSMPIALNWLSFTARWFRVGYCGSALRLFLLWLASQGATSLLALVYIWISVSGPEALKDVFADGRRASSFFSYGVQLRTSSTSVHVLC